MAKVRKSSKRKKKSALRTIGKGAVIGGSASLSTIMPLVVARKMVKSSNMIKVGTLPGLFASIAARGILTGAGIGAGVAAYQKWKKRKK